MTQFEQALAEIEQRYRRQWKESIPRIRDELARQGCADIDAEIAGACAAFDEQMSEAMQTIRNHVVDFIAEATSRETKH